MTMVYLLAHSLCAAFLLGALSHQAAASWRAPGSGRAATLLPAFITVRGALYTRAIIISYLLTMLLGDIIYGPYRIDVKTMLFDLNLYAWNGTFEIKEHLASFGLYLLPLYWLVWRAPLHAEHHGLRRGLSTFLALIVWYNLIVGHLLNNIKGVGFQ